MPKYLQYDISPGQRFGKLVAIRKLDERTSDGIVQWECLCDCGRTTHVRKYGLLREGRGVTRSCGCLHKTSVTSHGCSMTSEYNTWASMKKRCLNPNHKSYLDYGGRGITICDEWQQGFEAFIRDMGPKPSPRHQLERKDNDGNYCPENCIWATPKDQGNNKRTSRRICFNGSTRTLSQWADLCGIGITTLHARLKKGWPLNKALSPLK